VKGEAWDTDDLTVPENVLFWEACALWPEQEPGISQTCLVFLQPLRCSTKPLLLARLQANELTFKACAKFVTDLTAKRCCFARTDG
jgi:hypothetical protein